VSLWEVLLVFGYIKPCVPELRVKENEFYRAVYCGLCHALGQKSRLLSFTLSYDFVFLATVRMAVEKEKSVELASKRCIAHPFKKRYYLKANPSLEASARAAAILLYYNLLDDINDSHGVKKLIAKMALPKAASLRKKNIGDGVLDSLVAKELELMAKEEQKGQGSVYDLAEPFGRLLGAVFAHGVEDEKRRRALYAFGRCIGRWIYIIDAVDDIDDDIKSGSFNRLIAERQAVGKEAFARNMEDALIFELAEAEKVLVLFDTDDEGLMNIVKNILYLGMPENARKVLCGNSDTKKKRKAKTVK